MRIYDIYIYICRYIRIYNIYADICGWCKRPVQVCNAWISSGVSRDASDLKRIQQLLVSSLQNLQTSTHELIISRYTLRILSRIMFQLDKLDKIKFYNLIWFDYDCISISRFPFFLNSYILHVKLEELKKKYRHGHKEEYVLT